MLASLAFPVLAILSFPSFVVAQSACNDSEFASLACLRSNDGAASICAMASPRTITLTVTTTTLDINTQTLTAHATSQTTVNVTTTEMSTKTITTGPIQTITTFETKLSTESATLTTYVQKAQVAAAFDPMCNPSSALSDLGSLPSDALFTACSCIGNRIPIRTTTLIVTAPAVQTRTTDFAGTAPTTTLYEIVRSTTTVTARPTHFVTITTLSCITSTKTRSYAAPTFTSVFGPKAGCIDAASSSVKALDASIRDLQSAADECKGLCSQESTCSFVYAQGLTTKRGGAPSFQCSFNDHPFQTKDDLVCGKNIGIYGAAVGYDASDRGTEEL